MQITVLDRIDGGISVLLRCPGFKPAADMSVDKVTVDLVVSPRELVEGGKELSKALALIVQSFGHDIVLQYLQRFEKRCNIEGVKPMPAPGMYIYLC